MTKFKQMIQWLQTASLRDVLDSDEALRLTMLAIMQAEQVQAAPVHSLSAAYALLFGTICAACEGSVTPQELEEREMVTLEQRLTLFAETAKVAYREYLKSSLPTKAN